MSRCRDHDFGNIYSASAGQLGIHFVAYSESGRKFFIMRALITRLRPDGFTSLLILIAILGMMHLLIRTSTYGAALYNDSLTYLSAAENFAAGSGWRHHRGTPILLHPPFFSVLLGFISLFGIEPVDAGRFVNIAAFGLIIAISGLYLGRHLRSHLLALGVAVVIMTSFYFSHFCSYVLTEPLFILFALLALMPLGAFPNRRSEKRVLAFSAVVAGLASVTRYIGITVIFSAVLVILARRGKPVRAKLRDAVAYAVFSSIPLALLLAYNWTVSNTLAGNRSALASGQSLFESLSQIGWGVGRRIFPTTAGPDWLVYPVLGAVGLVGVAAFVMISRKKRSLPHRWGPFLPFVVFALVYLVTLVLVMPFTSADPINARFLLPAVVPVLLVGAFLLDLFLHSEARGKMAAVKWVLATFILMGCVANVGFNVQRNLDATVGALATGYEGNAYDTARWADSEIGEYLRTHTINGWVYTNIPGVVWWLGDMPPPIRRVRENAVDCLAWLRLALAQFQRDSESATSKEAYIIWVEPKEDVKYWCDIPKPELPTQLERVASFSDGAVYRVIPNEAPRE